MSEARVTVSINGKDYPMACQPGEEAKVMALGNRIDEIARKISVSTGPIGESRLLVMAALIIADSLSELEKSAPSGNTAGVSTASEAPDADGGADGDGDDDGQKAKLAERIQNLTLRLEKLASGGA